MIRFVDVKEKGMNCSTFNKKKTGLMKEEEKSSCSEDEVLLFGGGEKTAERMMRISLVVGKEKSHTHPSLF